MEESLVVRQSLSCFEGHHGLRLGRMQTLSWKRWTCGSDISCTVSCRHCLRMKILCVIHIYLVSFTVCHAVGVVIQLHWTIFPMGELRLALELVLDLHTIQNWMHCIQLLRCHGIPWIWCTTHKPLVNEDSLCHGKCPHCTWNSYFKRWFSIAILEYNRVNPMKIQVFHGKTHHDSQ